MSRYLPPLAALRGFEAAARHLSITLAAQEMHVTPSAVSRQIKALERHYGLALFQRFTRRIELTQPGRELLEVVQSSFDLIERCSRRLPKTGRQQVLTLSVLPSLASFWLMPRLHAFGQQQPDIEVRLIASIAPANLASRDCDLCVRVGRMPGVSYGRNGPRIELQMLTSWTNAHAEELFPDVLVPVVAASTPMPKGTDLARMLSGQTFLHTLNRRHAWPDWLKAQGLSSINPFERSLEFAHFFMSLEAARAGKGIALIPSVLAHNYEARSALKALPFPRIASAGSYYLIADERRLQESGVARLRRWLLEEAATLRRVVVAGQ